MASGPEIVSSVGRFRTSVILLVGSASAIYYSSQILLGIGSLQKNLPTAIGVIIACLGFAALAAGYKTLESDWEHEKTLKDQTEELRKAHTKTIQRQAEEAQTATDEKENDDEPAEQANINERIEGTKEFSMGDVEREQQSEEKG